MRVFLAAFAAFALTDWVAVSPSVRNRALEYVCKPAALAALIAFAATMDPANRAQRAWFLAALAFSLTGDVLLMVDAFVPGLCAFLAAHVAYIVGFIEITTSLRAAAIVVPVAIVVGTPILSRAPAKLRAPVALYMGVISAMAVLALGSGNARAAAGASLFFVSDALIAWNRFVRPMPPVRPAIMATYHVGQAGLVLSLLG
jgi:uncharacterized membrane protein YhhN